MKPGLVLFLLAAALSARGQANHWRAFGKADGLPEDACISVTIGARGNLYVRHPGESSVAVLDGYTVTNLPAPGADRHRVYESPGGQLWSVAEDGLREFQAASPENFRGQWVLHPVPEIAAYFRAGGTNEPSLCPVRQNQVLVLLPDALLEVELDGMTNARVLVIHRVSQGRLGAFTALALASDGGLWISGEHGIAKISGPLREVKPDGEWTEWTPPAEWQLQHFGVVQEDETGNLTALAESAGSGAPTLVRNFAQRWESSVLNLKAPRFAWRAAGETWIATDDALWELPDGGTNAIANRDPALREGREIFDVAVEPGGAFWLATSRGLLRHAPTTWERGTGVPPRRSEVQPGVETHGRDARATPAGDWRVSFTAQNGDVWLGSAHEIAWGHGKRWRMFASTNQFGPENVSRFAEAPDGRIWCATLDKVWEFDGANWLEARSGFDRINDLCCSRDGTLWVATGQGLWRFLPAPPKLLSEGGRGVWFANGPEDGLPAANVRAVAEDRRGEVWADTPQGWSMFNPEADPDPPETFLQSSVIAQPDVREGAAVTFTFTGCDKWNQTAANRLLFSWRLDEREWSPFQEPAALMFDDLSVGKHRFQVRALDRNGNIEPKPALMEFAVVLPWYRQPGLVMILALALVMSLFFAGLAFNRHRKLLHSYAEVEQKVAERTRELEAAGRELLHSQKMNALGTLAAGIAHDFNNILSIIKGSAQIIEENTGDPQKIRTRLERIKTVVQQGAEIVEAMLGFSRGSGSAAPCDLNAVIAGTIKLLGDRFLRETEVRFERGNDLPEIFAPKDFIQQILLNFIFNAAEAQTGRRQIEIAARIAPEPPPGTVLKPVTAPRYLLVSVRDYGSGIAPEVQPRIFEPFFTTKALSAKRGTGLGLSMVYELAKKMDAGLAVESTVGQGSTFTLILPAQSSSSSFSSSQSKQEFEDEEEKEDENI